MKEQDFPRQDTAHEESVSKTQQKKEMHSLQELGKQLTKISPQLLAKCNLPESLAAAIAEYKRLPPRHGALRRQLQFIGKLMRNIDTAPIVDVLDEANRNVEREKRRFHQLEEIRDELISGNQETLDRIIEENADIDIQFLRQLIRQSAKERKEGKSPTAQRKLFAYLREMSGKNRD